MALLVVGLLVNTFLVSQATREAEPFAGGEVLELPGPDLNVRHWGPKDGPAVVLIHGYAASMAWWGTVPAALAAQGHRVIAIDVVGHGGSEAPGDDAAFGADGQSTAILEALDALGVDHATLVGHSMGGHIATAIAERAPDRIVAVAVIDTFADTGLVNRSLLNKAGCWPVLGALIDRFRGVDVLTEGSLQDGFADDFEVPDIAHASLEQLTHRALCHSSAANDLHEERATADRLADLGKPVLVVWGDRDVLTPPEPNLARYREAGLEPHVIEGSGHTPMLERPDDLLAILVPFLADLEA
ncbi:MAG: alpha/beta fold hydrolase [Nitriliruptorales bacterium]|nr:alpha/beta fold hydrolase [Nitriliruptorales bacterium]